MPTADNNSNSGLIGMVEKKIPNQFHSGNVLCQLDFTRALQGWKDSQGVTEPSCPYKEMQGKGLNVFYPQFDFLCNICHWLESKPGRVVC